MALIVEDGTGLLNAESYASVAEADAYHLARGGEASWVDLDTDIKEQLLRKASDYLVESYRMRWKGVRNKQDQALDWPRTGVIHEETFEVINGQFAYPSYTVASNVVPREVKTATIVLALKAKAGELSADLERAVLSETVGPLSVTYDRGSPEQKRYPQIDGMLTPYLKGSSMTTRLARV
jgi:hypothetical protein